MDQFNPFNQSQAFRWSSPIWEEVEAGEDRNATPGIWMVSIIYGYLDGDQKEEAAADLNYSGAGQQIGITSTYTNWTKASRVSSA